MIGALQGGATCAEGMVCIAIFALAMIYTLLQRQQKPTIWLVRRGSLEHSMCTSDAWKHTDSMEHEPWRLVEKRRVGSRSCLIGMLGDLVDRIFFTEQSLLDDPGHSALTVLAM